MVTSETWRVAFEALRASKVKAFLTMLGVIIGSACIVLVVTVALTGRRYILGVIEGIGSNLIYAYYVQAGPEHTRALGDEISLSDMTAVQESIPQVAAVAGTYDLPISMTITGVERAVNLVGVTQRFQQIRNLEVLRGRFVDDTDIRLHSTACVISKNLANLLPFGDPVGQQIKVGEFNLTVVGVFRERISTFGQSEIASESVVIPFPLMSYYTGQDFLKILYAQARQPEDVGGVTLGVRRVLESRHRRGATYSVQNLSSLLDAARTIAKALTWVLLITSFIALAVSGVGIMNIMLVTVAERTREIGIRMAVGARRREIQCQFLAEALMISGTGAIIGILIAVSIPIFLRPFLPENLNVPISALSVVISFLTSSVTGIVFGYLPANRAARLQPTESLHHE
jgi:putative ABC transport system permease protein